MTDACLHRQDRPRNRSIDDIDGTNWQSVSVYRGSIRAYRTTYRPVECGSLDISRIVDQCSAMFVRLAIVTAALCLSNGVGKTFFSSFRFSPNYPIISIDIYIKEYKRCKLILFGRSFFTPIKRNFIFIPTFFFKETATIPC